jgi:hypothetical protein
MAEFPVLMIDEPTPVSAKERDEWWARLMGYRVNADGRLILIESRRHEGDFAGLIRQVKDNAKMWSYPPKSWPA